MSAGDELNRIAVDLTQAALLAPVRASLAVVKTAFDVEADAKQFAPIDTGNLRSSITSGPIGEDRALRPGDLSAEIGPTAEYGEYVEDGTSRQAPAAYMGPAADRRFPPFVQAMEQIGAQVL